MKKKLKILLEILITIIFCIFILNKISLFQKSYSYESDSRSVALFYELPRNTVDVLFAGDSHVYCSIIPQQIYDDSGITSASIATNKQFIGNTYWMIKEALVKQDIKMIVIDSHFIEDSLREPNNLMHFVSGITMLPDFSTNKYMYYKDLHNIDYGLSKDIKYKDLMGLTQFNNDFDKKYYSINSLIKFLIIPEYYYKTFGYYPDLTVTKLSELKDGTVRNEDIDFEQTIACDYLRKIKLLCDESKIKLVITKIPFYSDNANKSIYEQIEKWASENNVDFIDLFNLIEEIKIDLKTDFRDETHMNINGARKITNYMTNYLVNSFIFVDHRGNPKYSLWNNNDFDYGIYEK